MIDATLDGKRELQRVIGAFEQYVELAARQGTQIEELKRSAINVNHIAQVIRELADQSNLLAVNATIEAARAGEQGRGFAVVANEVRKLASETKLYAKEVEQVVKSISEAVLQTVALIYSGQEQAAKSMLHTKGASAVFEQLFQLVSMNQKSMGQIHHNAEEAGLEGSNVLKTVNDLVIKIENTRGWQI